MHHSILTFFFVPSTIIACHIGQAVGRHPFVEAVFDPCPFLGPSMTASSETTSCGDCAVASVAAEEQRRVSSGLFQTDSL